MRDPARRGGYSIAAVSKLTGISCHSLRAWERRYGFPVPHRSPSGHRRYAASQVQTLRHLVALIRRGQPVGKVMADLQAGRLEIPGPADAAAAGPSPAVPELVARILAADPAGAEALFAELARTLPPLDLVEQVIEPALIDVGERWFCGRCGVFEEHCVSSFLIRKLHGLIDAAKRANVRPRHTALIGTAQGERHEGGVLIVTLALELAGWRVLNLGVDLPIREYQAAVARWRPDALGISFVLSRNITRRFAELARIRDVPVFVGGRSILNYQALARRFGLIPLPGPARAVVGALSAEVRRRSGPSDSGANPPAARDAAPGEAPDGPDRA